MVLLVLAKAVVPWIVELNYVIVLRIVYAVQQGAIERVLTIAIWNTRHILIISYTCYS